MTNETSRVLTLVFTDLADSTALKTQRGDTIVGDLISQHRDHVTQLAQDSNGRIIDWAGDGCFLTFETSSAAVTFALRLEQIHADHAELPGVRIGRGSVVGAGSVVTKDVPPMVVAAGNPARVVRRFDARYPDGASLNTLALVSLRRIGPR